MISTSDLQALIDKLDGGSQGVDLVKIGQQFAQQGTSRNPRRMRVALDIESCMDRFYGGYFSDWACGGQFNRCFEFVQLLVMALKSAHIDVTVFFDGTLKENKKMQIERNDVRQRTISVLKHIRMIGTPPPKIWWLPPSGLRVCLRNALRSLDIPIVQTIHDHTMEVIDFFNEHKLNGIIGLHPDYIISSISRYFSSHDLRLSYKGALETKEFINSTVSKSLQVSQEQLAVIAVLLGGYILIDESTLKKIYQKINVEFNQDFEARIRQLANLVRTIPAGSSSEEIIGRLNLEIYADILKESIEYYQRKGTFCGKRYLGNKKKPITEIVRNIDVVLETPIAPMASETNENDEIANKILKSVSKIVDEADIVAPPSQEVVKKCVKFVYSLPAEVLRTSYQRHQRGTMDARIYILLTKKEILLPQILEDEQYREMIPIHIFYRPARQMIYAILFNLYHQKYMCSKTKDNLPMPEVIINEWIWSPQNEYNKPDEVYATQLPWAVPTIQRLWFGTTFDDKHRRMRAFLTVMRSDTAMMLNRNFVPSHLLVLACVLRYIVTSSERNVISRHELDAFLVTAFSPQLGNIEYTQEMVLPGVYLRGVSLATLFMQGVETASLANDACGVPLPWNLTNPWLFFDGKLFHLKLKMSVCLQNIRELCDENLDLVMKVERCRKAILEDVENLVPPAEPIFRQQMLPYPTQHHYNKNMQIPIFGPNNYGYMQTSMQQQMLCNANMTPFGTQRFQKNQQLIHSQNINQKVLQRNAGVPGAGNFQKNNGYQLKVGGVVVGSWANGSRNQPPRINRGMNSQQIRYPINQKFSRPTNNRYRLGNTGMLTAFNQKSTNRITNKKKPKTKKEVKKGDEDKNVEVEKKTILKDEKKEVDDNVQKNEGNDANLSDDNNQTPDEKTNGTVEETDESCDRKDDKTAASEVAAVEIEQQQSNVKNGKVNNTNNKKNKKNAKGKTDSQVNDEIVGEVNT